MMRGFLCLVPRPQYFAAVSGFGSSGLERKFKCEPFVLDTSPKSIDRVDLGDWPRVFSSGQHFHHPRRHPRNTRVNIIGGRPGKHV